MKLPSLCWGGLYSLPWTLSARVILVLGPTFSAPTCSRLCASSSSFSYLEVGLCLPVGLHGGLEALDKALFSTGVAEGAIVVFVGEG